jgi:hypothetical protein
MKTQLNEVRRMQKLAGILKEEDMSSAANNPETVSSAQKAQIGKTIEAWGLKHVTAAPEIFGEIITDNLPRKLKSPMLAKFNDNMFKSLIQLSTDYHTGTLGIEQAVDKAIEIVTDPSNYTTGDTAVNEAKGVKKFYI